MLYDGFVPTTNMQFENGPMQNKWKGERWNDPTRSPDVDIDVL